MSGNLHLEGGLPLPGVGFLGEIYFGEMSEIFKVENVGQ